MSIRQTQDSRSLSCVVLRITHQEIELFSRFSLFLSELNRTVKEKDWKRLDELITQMNEIAQAIVEVERVRETTMIGLKNSLGLADNTSSSDILSLFPIDARKDFAIAIKRLKMEVLKVKVAARGLNYYLASVSHLLRNVLEEIFPHTRGKIYASNGKDAQRAGDSMMINKEL